MPQPQPQPTLLTSRLERGVLVLTPTAPSIHSDELANDLARELLAAAATTEGAPRAVVDFQHVRTISAAGLRAILNFRRHVRQRDGQLLLCGLSADVADIFFTTRLVSTTSSSVIPFAMAPDVATAVAHLSKGVAP